MKRLNDTVPADTPSPPAPALPPLCVDLDGTLIRTDLLYESFIAVMTAMPWLLLRVPFWLLRGKALALLIERLRSGM